VALPAWKLYWCTTADHDEDWFIVARSKHAARRFHDDQEGYQPGAAEATYVLTLPPALQPTAEHGWPSLELLRSCGGEVLRPESPRVVRFSDHVFSEGMLDDELLQATDDLAERMGRGRPNRTTRRPGRPS
jgi:hypothetical protein